MDSYTKIIRYPVYILLFIFFGFTNLIPHVGSSSLTLLTLTGLPFCFSKKARSVVTKGDKAVFLVIILFFLLYLINYLANRLLGNLANPSLEILDHRFRLLTFVPILILFKNIKTNKTVLWGSVCFGAAISGIYAIYSSSGLSTGVRISGSYHSIAFGYLSVLMAFICLFSIDHFCRQKKPAVLIPTVSFALAMFATYLSGTKAAWFSIPALLIILFLYKKLSGLVLLIGVAIVFAFVYQVPNNLLDNRIQSMFKDWEGYRKGIKRSSSVSGRLELWKASYILWKESPIVGIGAGNFKFDKDQLIANSDISKAVQEFRTPHNVFLNSLVETGVLGFTLVWGVFLTPLAILVNQFRLCSSYVNRGINFAAILTIIGFIQFGMTESVFIRNVLISFYIITLALTYSYTNENPKNSANLHT